MSLGVRTSAAAARAEIDVRSRSIARDAIDADALVGQLKGNKAFIGQATRDYAGRFLYELLQNAYDAHPRGTTGRVHILLDEGGGEHGVLYVANAGKPFDYDDFRAISEIAQSSKQPGEGIGNKGVGFKSVLQVSEWPEVYSSSSSPTREAFDGYCFGFARPDDFLRLANGDVAAAAILDDRVSPYALPVVVDAQDDNVRAFAAEGMTTVFRLPLRSSIALGLANEQIREIQTSVAPVLLFLDRIGTLVLDVRGVEPLRETLVRQRRATDSPPGVEVEDVDLGPAGKYLVVRRGIEHASFMAAIRASIDAQLIDPDWEAWEQEVAVSVAVRVDADLDEGRLFCFLPLGPHAKAPSAAHVNAPFVVRLARDALIDDVPLNDLLFEAVADACVAAGLYLRADTRNTNVVPDLLTWSSRLSILRDAFTRCGSDLAEAPFIPVLGGARWASLASSYHWDESGMTVMTANRVAESTASPIVATSLGSGRLDRVLRLHYDVMGIAMDPRPETMAEWAEAVAASLLASGARRSRRFDASGWLTFYDELAALFGANGSSLAGRRILLDDTLELQPCLGGEREDARSTPAIFFQARGDEADEEADAAADVSIPASLTRHLAYMHSGLNWQQPNPQGRPENRPGRRFLESHSLVRPFRRQALFERIRDVLERSTAKRVRADALRLVFNLASSGPYTQRPGLNELKLRVPTTGGWALAALARFSESWPDTSGALLRRLITDAAEQSPELAGLSNQMLLGPEHWPFRVDPEKWISFLRRIGVKDGLRPTVVRASVGDYAGRMWKPSAVARWAGLSDEDTTIWAPAVELADRDGWHRDTVYRSTAIVRIPGQSDFAALERSTRELFGRLVGAGLGTWPSSAESFAIRRPRHTNAPDEHRWPSPAWSFLETAAWVPVSRPGDPGSFDLAVPKHVWQFRDDGEAQPLFAPLLAGDLRHRVEGDPTLSARLRSLGVRQWSDPEQAAERLGLLAELFERAGIAESQLATFRKAYERSWGQLISEAAMAPWTSKEDVKLVVSRHGQLGLFPTEGSPDERLFVLGEPDRLSETLLGSLDVPVLRVEPADGAAAAELLLPLLADRVRVIRSGDFRVFVDGNSVDSDAQLPLLVAPGRGWLVDLLALTLELKATQFNRQTVQTVRTAVEKLRRVHLQAGRDLHIELDDEVISLPTFLQRVIALPTADDPIIAYIDHADQFGWSTLEQIAQPMADVVGQGMSGAELRLVVAGLARRGATDELFAPTDEDYSHAFGESIARIAEVRHGLRGVVDDLVHLLRPVIEHMLHVDLLQLMAATDDDSNTDGGIEALLAPYEDGLPDDLTAAALIARAREARTLADLRDGLNLDYRAFNATLAGLGRPYAPFRNDEGQRFAFAAHIAGRRSSVVDALRAAHLDAFDAGDDLATYVAASSELARAMLRRAPSDETLVLTLEPDPDWVENFDLPPDELMDRQVDDWVSAVGARPGDDAALSPLDDVRAENRRTIASFVDRARPIIGAWSGQRTDADPPAWARPEQPADLVERFAVSGLFDFRALTDDMVIQTLVQWGEWPSEMPLTLSVTELDITSEDLAKQQSAGDRAKWLREQERRTVALDGHRVSLEPSQVEDLIALVRSGITPELLATPARASSLETLGKSRRRKGTSGGGDRSPFRGRRLSEAKAETIGFIGELVAYDWLVAQFAIEPASWVSSNRRFVFPDDAGDDGLGYDFQIPRRRGRPWLFEVKSASDADATSFELSEAEIRAAQEHTAKGEYQILFIRDVLNSAMRSVHILPNPLDPVAQGRYRVVGTGIRYAFRLEGS